ncbi:MAG: peptidyl-prolyl cis-trans isomerase [Sulfuriflexus sp.]|nr:peptidyl-prolyl cis-trans isomerase [Sulfuriflexus sp.]
MKKITTLAISFALCGFLTACGGGDNASAKSDDMKKDMAMDNGPTMAEKDDDIIATVNGKPVLGINFKAYVKQRKLGRPEADKISDARMLDEYINFELALQDAEKNNLQDKASVKQEIKNQRRTTLVNAAFNNFTTQNPLTEAEMKKDYEARMSELTLTEYNLRHILLTNGDDATTVVKALNKGGDFLALVEQYSTGPSSKDKGLLGWQSEFDLLPEFRAPVSQLKKGEYARTPIKTRFGWHIVYLNDKRVSPPPAYEEVKDRVRTVLQRQQVEKYFLQLRTTAEIKITDFEANIPAIPEHQGVNIKQYSNN